MQQCWIVITYIDTFKHIFIRVRLSGVFHHRWDGQIGDWWNSVVIDIDIYDGRTLENQPKISGWPS